VSPARAGAAEHPLIAAWSTSHRVTAFLFENLSDEVLALRVPGAPRRTVRMIAAHVHNCRGSWVRKLGGRDGIAEPAPVDRHRVGRDELLAALEESHRAMVALVAAALARGGEMVKPAWMNLPPEAVHFVSYMIAHEGHHRGQIVMIARAHGHRLPAEVTNGLWQWSRRAAELEG